MEREKLATLTQWLLIWGGAASLFREHAHFLVPLKGRRGSFIITNGEITLHQSFLFAFTYTQASIFAFNGCKRSSNYGAIKAPLKEKSNAKKAIYTPYTLLAKHISL